MRREGSPWTGLWAVFFKEMADHLTGLRMRILEVLILLSALGALYTGSQALRQTVGEDPFLYLKLLTTAQDPLPSFVGFLSFFIPLAAIALAFDAVNGEYARGTLSRVLSQPIYRDALLFGKFLAGLGTLALLLFALFLMVVGLGLLRLGVPPGSEEVGRAFFFLLATLGYAGVWLALGLLFSVLFRQPATAAAGDDPAGCMAELGSDFDRSRALALDHPGIAESVHQRAAALGNQLSGHRVAILAPLFLGRALVEHYFGPQGAGVGELHMRRVMRHHDRRLHTEPARGPCNALRMISRRSGDDALI